MNVHRVACLTLVALLIGLGPASAQNTTTYEQLFDKTSHDFGYVQRGRVMVPFKITNKFAQRLHIASAVPSCRVCTVAKIENDTLAPGESTTLEAGFDTTLFTGPRSVSVTITFDQPSYAQVRLQLVCNARTDIVIVPGDISFGTVKRGVAESKTMTIEYAGKSDWHLALRPGANSWLDLKLEEKHRGDGKVGYELSAALKPDAPPGLLRERVVLDVDDAYNKTLEVAVQGTIQADVFLSPSALSFGTIHGSAAAAKNVLVRGAPGVRPFKLVSIEASEGPFEIEVPEDTRPFHVLKVGLKAGQPKGPVSQRFDIKTDVDSEPVRLTVTANLAD
jgi:hypothetical protein